MTPNQSQDSILSLVIKTSFIFPSVIRGIKMLDILSDYYIVIKETVDR